MAWRCLPIGAVLSFAALLLPVAPLRAGDRVHAGKRPITRPPSTSATFLASVTPAVRVQRPIAVVVTPPSQPAAEPLYVDIRGPDGQIQRFPVEGGRAAIQYRQVILHPGEMLTIRWTPAK